VEKLRVSQNEGRQKLYLVVSAMKIALTFGMAFALVPELGSAHAVFTSLTSSHPGIDSARFLPECVIYEHVMYKSL